METESSNNLMTDYLVNYLLFSILFSIPNLNSLILFNLS